MIDRVGIEQILAQYSKHGWKLRRVLFSQALSDAVPDLAGLFGGVDIKPSELDGLWFSRASRPGVTAWELRRLTATPFALVTAVEDGADQQTAESILTETEEKMMNTARRGNGSSAH